MKKIVVTGAGGFIAGHLVQELLRQGHTVRAVDIKPLNEWYQLSDNAENLVLDLRLRENCYQGRQRMPRTVQPRGRHGRHGLYREQQSRLHDQRPH